jgi:hypothetical protein
MMIKLENNLNKYLFYKIIQIKNLITVLQKLFKKIIINMINSYQIIIITCMMIFLKAKLEWI